MEITKILNEAADIFDKTAEYLEKTESVRIAEENKIRNARAQKLASQISEATGQDVEPHLVEKLSGLGSDVQELLGRLTGSDTVDSLGGPPEQEKHASVDGVPPEDNRLLQWINS